MKKLFTLLLVLCVAAIACAFCFPGCTAEQGTIRLIEVTHSVFYAPLYAAIDGGFFENEGITIELTNGGGADKCMTAVLANQADIGFHGPEAVIYIDDFEWSDLEGKEVIGGRRGGVPAMALEHAMLVNGLVDGVNVTINYDVQYDLIGAAFEGGTGDFCTMFEPAASAMEDRGVGYKVASVGEAAGDMPFTAFSAKQSWLEENAETAAAFCRAMTRAIDFVQTSSAEKIAEVVLPSFPGTDVATLANAIQAYKDIGAYSSSLVMDKSDLDALQAIIIEAGVIDEKVDFEKIVDNSFAEAAESEVSGA